MTETARRIALAALVFSSCVRSEDLDVTFVLPASPDPFTSVERVEVRGVVEGARLELGEHRWDLGSFALPPVPPEVERLVFLGRAADGRVVASGETPALDLLLAPPDDTIEVFFHTVGGLNRLPLELPWLGPSHALPLDGGGALLTPAADDCAPRPSVVWRRGRLRDGPELPPELGRDPAWSRREGPTFIIGRASECGAAAWGVLWSDEGGAVRLERASDPIDAPPGARVRALGERRAVVAGGAATPPARTVTLLNAVDLTARVVGALDRARVDGLVAPLGSDRVAVIGGRARADTATASADASVFSLSSGAVVGGLPIPEARAGGAAVVTRSGAVYLAGGIADALGVLVPLPGTDAAAAMPSLQHARISGEGHLIDLDDGSLLWVSSNGAIRWVQLLPELTRPVREAGAAAGWAAASTGPGQALVVDPQGALHAFASGPQARLGAEAPSLEPIAPNLPLGLVPLRSGAWSTASDGGIRGEAPSAFSVQLRPDEQLILGREARSDFDLRLDLALGPQARASVVFGRTSDDFDHLVLHGTPQVVRGPLRRATAPVVCSPAIVPELANPFTEVRVRVRRSGRTVRLDVGDDGDDELVCTTPSPQPGLIAVGVVNGAVEFRSIRLR